ncbi:MAG: DivIVA domain-containing protein [Bacilli bacterium]|jgi:DivIVA domain-containing protein|nr:DivIVA domain-containing protein [Bacilli bacterium]
MKNDEIVLTPDALLNWDFHLDARGYRPQEVDKALDIVISDYRTYERKISALNNQIEELNNEILDLKHKLRNARESIEIVKSTDKEVSNVDLLRRVSQLEKIIYGDKKE